MKWIWIRKDGRDEVNQYVYFTDSFVREEAEAAGGDPVLCRVTADSQYALWINGRFVDCGQYADYPFYKVYDELDVTPYLVDGRNEIQFLVYYQGTDSSTYTRGEPGLAYRIFRGELTYAQSSEYTACAQAEAYRNGPMELVTGQLGYAFEYDATRRCGPFAQAVDSGKTILFAENPAFPPEHDDNCLVLYPRPIRKLTVLPQKDARIAAQGFFRDADTYRDASPAMRMQFAFLSSRPLGDITVPAYPPHAHIQGKDANPDAPGMHFTGKFENGENGIYVVIDLGREEAGYFDIDIDAPAGTDVLISYGEHLDDLRARAYLGGRCFSGRYRCRGGGRERFTHYNKRLGLRYLQLYVCANDFTLYYAGVRPAEYPLACRGKFVSSDSLHNQIHDTCVRTLLLCMHEHYEDCPWREQALYAMDSRNQMLCGFYAFGEYEFAKASIRLLAKGQREDGLLELCAPAKVSITIPCFSLMWVVELYEYVLYSGDLAFAAECFPTVERLIRAFWVKAHGHEILNAWREPQYWNFYEWAPWLDNGGPAGDPNLGSPENYDALLTLFYVLALKAATRMARWLNKNHAATDTTDYRELASWYSMLSESTSEKFHSVFWNEEAGAYASYIVDGVQTHYCELANSLALYADVVPPSLRGAVAERLTGNKGVATGAEPPVLVPTTLSHTVFKYEALLSFGDTYAAYVLQDIRDKWGHMLYNRATSFWEMIEGSWSFDEAGSLCHGWSAIPLLVYYKYVLGVTPTALGFEDYTFKPLRTPLLAVSGTVPEPNGRQLQVTVSGNGFEVTQA